MSRESWLSVLGLFAVEHASADLDRVTDYLDRIVAMLLALVDEANRAVVIDHEAVDDQTVADRADVGRSEGCGSFHDGCEGPGLARTGAFLYL